MFNRIFLNQKKNKIKEAIERKKKDYELGQTVLKLDIFLIEKNLLSDEEDRQIILDAIDKLSESLIRLEVDIFELEFQLYNLESR